VVEQIDSSASLYSKTIQGHHICLLVKLLVCFAFCVTTDITIIHIPVSISTHAVNKHKSYGRK